MSRIELKGLAACAALAVGIGVVLANPRMAELWPVALGLCVLVVLLGFGFAVRGWPILCVALLGLTLACRAKVAEERLYRESPWMRSSARREMRTTPSASPLRKDLSARVALGGEAESELVALNRAILLGERRRLPSRLKRVFVDSGAIHLFAISGLHVMVVAKVLMFLVAVCFVPWRVQGLVALPILWAYVVLIGSPPSAVRAALMASFYFGAPVFWRRPNGLVAWSLSFLVIHLLLPEQLSEVGSLFSFIVMLALVVASRTVRKMRHAAFQVVALTFVAWAAGVPIAAAAFGRLTPGGLVANLMLVPTAVYAVVSGIVGLAASFLWEPLAVHLNSLSLLVTKAMVGIAAAVARLPYAAVEIPRWGVWECGGWYLALGLGFYLIRRIQARRQTF